MTGSRALVIGAARGIGASAACALAADGWSVLAADMQPCDATLDVIRSAGGKADAIRLDIADTDAVATFMAGPDLADVGAVVVAAAILGPLIDLEEYDRASWDRVIGINLTGVFFCAQAAANRLAANGGGRLILFGSPAGRNPARTNIAAYIASKAAIPTLVKALSAVYDRKGVRVAGLEPGRTNTPMIMGPIYDDESSAVNQDLPVERILEPEDIASVVAFLCSRRADAITNAYWTISSRS